MTRQILVVSTLAELDTARQKLAGPVGLVPTMGALHAGHISLVKLALEECASVLVSIFVNPTQFGANEDLAKYPRAIERDLELSTAAGEDLLWTPTAEGMYPPGFQAWVEVGEMTRTLEGAMRPGHFRGVTTVVAKLFSAVRPDRAYFGQKDAQQAAVIRQMTRDLNFPIEIVVGPTIREDDGLALSSRNEFLQGPERSAATVLYRSLNAAKTAYEKGERDGEKLRSVMKDTLALEPLANVQYVSCADYATLQELAHVEGKTLLSMAVFVGKTRLIDNFVLG